MLFILEYYVLGLKVFTPKLIDLKTALVYVKMDIALFKLGCAGLPNFGLGMQNLDRLPRTVADDFAVRFGKTKRTSKG